MCKKENIMPTGSNENLNDKTSLFPTCNNLVIDTSGEITDLNLGIKYLKEKGENGIWYTCLPGHVFSLSKPEVKIKTAVLVGLAYKTPGFSFIYLEVVDMLYKDGNSDNLHPSNLVWKYPEEGLEYHPKPGFFHIPGYSRYAINKDGKVFSTFKNRLLSSYVSADDYYVLSLKSDILKTFGVTIARLLGLTFIKYTSDVEDLDINHIDRNTRNDKIANLEWLTHGDNMRHWQLLNGQMETTYEEGLAFEKRYGVNPFELYVNNAPKRLETQTNWRKTNKLQYLAKNPYVKGMNPEIHRKDLITGEIVVFKNQADAAKAIGCTSANIGFAVNKQTPHFAGEDGRYMFKKADADWFPVTYNDRPSKNGKPRKIISENLVTGEIKEYSNAVQFYKENNLRQCLVERRLWKHGEGVLENIHFKYKPNILV